MRGDTGRTDSPAVRAILAIVAVALIAILLYLVSLSSQPAINKITPEPNSTTPPGIVKVEARVNAARPIQEVILLIDGTRASPAVIPHGDRSWTLRFQSVLPKGEHEAFVRVIDETGEIQEHSWTFISTGARVMPTVAFSAPPENVTLAQGLIRLSATASSDAPIETATLTINGEEYPVDVSKLRDATEEATGNSPGPHEIALERAFEAGTYNVELTVTDEQGDTSESRWTFSVTSDPAKATARYFSVNEVYVAEPFKSFWEQNQGATIFGNPVSPEFVNEDGIPMQYFEYARFERAEDGNVNLGLLGSEALHSSHEPVNRPRNLNGVYFEETGHTLTGKFQEFWNANGGLRIFGFPITEVFDEGGVKVQYFERARFELGQEGETSSVKLTPLGAQAWTAESGS